MSTQESIKELLLATQREGMEALVRMLVDKGFFEAPASTRFHGSYKGGLAAHSLKVYELLARYVDDLKINKTLAGGQKPLEIAIDTITITGLLHDVCKIGAYVRTKADDGWTNNRDKPKGHALLSIKRIKGFIKLTELEEMMILYHMGVYGLNEFDEKAGEYPLRGDDTLSKEARYGKSMANAWFHNPICKLMYFCDELATLEEKASEVQATT